MKSAHIIDYGIGNIFNVVRAIKHIGYNAVICREPEILTEAEYIILPGVGAFGDCMNALQEKGFVPAVLEHVHNNKSLFAICVGMHLLADVSEEFGIHKGLGLIPGVVKRINPVDPAKKIRIPHISWRPLCKNEKYNSEINLFDAYYYFIHSYVFFPKDYKNEIAYCLYEGVHISAIINLGNIYGIQFHPEKSGPAGLALLASLLKSKIKKAC